MGWVTVPLGRLRLRLHLLLPVVVVGLTFVDDLAVRYLLLLGTLLLHEGAHAVSALGLGTGPVVVSIWPWFGRADVEAFKDRREAAVALAAPAANLLAAAAFLWAGGEPTLQLGRSPLLDLALTANLLMGVGNLLPLPPADGGRALRALRRRI